MPRMLLISVVSFPTFEDRLQGDIEINLVYGPREIRDERAHGEEGRSRMTREIFPTSRNEIFHSRWRAIFEREINHVAKHEHP